MAHEVFISYGSPDKAIADAACARLEGRGIRCWIAPRDVLPGRQYAEAIADALQGSRALVLIFSSHANYSKHVAKEVERAVSNGLPVVPLRIEAVTPSGALDYFISSVHWLDAITPPLEHHLDELADSVLRLLKRDGATLGAPVAPGAPAARAEPAPREAKASRARAIGVALAVLVLSIAGWKLLGSRSGDAVTGCWRWANGVVLHIEATGQVTGSPLVGQWSRAGDRQYSIVWPTFVDKMQISADGRTLTGTNNYGLPQGAVRKGLASAGQRRIVGTWSYNTLPTVISADGNVDAGPFHGTWHTSDNTTFTVEWTHRPIDTLSLLSEGTELKGSNNFGIPITATKAACSP